MFEIDGKELDLTNLHSGITIKEGGYIEQAKDGQVVRMTKAELDTVKAELAELKGE